MPKVELMTAKERQLWYWRKEMESCHRRMRVYRPDSEDYRHWREKYESLRCCSPQACKESDTTQQLNDNIIHQCSLKNM